MDKKLKIAGVAAGLGLAYYFLNKTSVSFSNFDPQLKTVDVNVSVGLSTYSTTIDISTPKKDAFKFLNKNVNLAITKSGIVSVVVTNQNKEELDKAMFKFSAQPLEPANLNNIEVQEVKEVRYEK
ncbi:hypothetical protein [Mesoflavibacter sp. CH_XMU1404-2]|uniref:hypothetical protein n=1 Tax=Mesoflavibacter sp. CH_XMU1404-2 TaxID=3107766 RepID=UPI0030095877